MPHLSDYFWYVQVHIFLFPHYFLILCFVFDVNFDLLVFFGWLIYMSLCLTAPVYIAAVPTFRLQNSFVPSLQLLVLVKSYTNSAL